jgi:hypothetical protein
VRWVQLDELLPAQPTLAGFSSLKVRAKVQRRKIVRHRPVASRVPDQKCTVFKIFQVINCHCS